jgi:O-antigen/teichoic acid export membrane protein
VTAVDPDTAAPQANDGIGAVVRGFSALAASQLVGQLIGFVALVYVARKVGASNLGAYTFALLLATYFNLFASVGIDYLAMRDVGQHPDTLASVAGETILLQGALSGLLYVLLVLTGPLLAPSHEVRHLLPIVGLTMLTTTFTLDWALLALGRSTSLAACRIAGQLVYGCLVPIFVVGGTTGVVRYAWLNVIGFAVTAVAVMWVFFRVAPVRLRVNGPHALIHRFWRSIPFGYSRVMIQIYAGVSTLMVGYLETTRSVGVYAVAGKLPAALGAFASIWITVLFPYAARKLANDTQAFASDLGRIVTAATIIGVAVVVGAVLCAGTVMTALFGESFKGASTPFVLLSVSAALILVQANFSNVLLAGGSERQFVVIMTAAAVMIVVLNVILIPPFGTTGAASATALGEAVLTTATFVAVRRRLGPISLESARLARGGLAVATMALAMYGARFVGGAGVQVAAGLIAAVAGALLFRVFDLDLLRG